jgi:hypothetical protein
MALAWGNNGRLWRYNYRILMGTGYWILVLPIAASQIVTLWMMALASDFSQVTATQIAEMMTPILGAFLVAHSMAPEYRSGVGGVLACKPVSLHRVVSMRAGLALAAAVFLTWVTLSVCSAGLKPIEVGKPVLAALPSLWFLSMLALTFASLFRNALAGFAVAAALWGVDQALGYSIHPLLSLQGLHASEAQDALAVLWPWSKVALVVAGFVLLTIHGRLLRGLYQMADRGNVVRVVGVVSALLVGYCASGAATVVSYAWLNRSNLTVPDVVWLQRQLKIYGPIPVAQFFGPAFSVYVSEVSPQISRAPTLRVERLEAALKRWPRSIWADGIAFTLGREQERANAPASVAAYQRVADVYAASPFAPRALAQIVRMDQANIPVETRLSAARRLVAEFPRSPLVDVGVSYLSERYPAQVPLDEMAAAAEIATHASVPSRRPLWLVNLADFREKQGKRAEAIAAAQEALRMARQLREIEQKSVSDAPGSTSASRPQLDSAINAAETTLKRLGAPAN